jgi:hypothetical protein
MAESYEDQLARVRAMATGAGTWDLSDNDLAALRAVLAEMGRREEALGSVRRSLVEAAAQLVQDWPGIPNQQDVADAIRDLAEVTP